MTRKGRAITLSLSEPDKQALQTIALEFGYTWGTDKPNISKLVEAIATGQLLIAPNHDWSADLINTLHHAMTGLSERGHRKKAQIIAELLLKRSELQNPLRREIERFLETSQKPNWRQRLEEFIAHQQPFQLAYQDAAQRVWTFHIHFAQIIPRDRHDYLDCWCQETEGNVDLPALQHNWSLRLDRITDAALAPITTQWRDTLDPLRVELHLYNGLAFAYEPRPNDRYNDWLPDQSQIRRVLRDVSSSFWLFREVLPYGEDCLIVAPSELRAKFVRKLNHLQERYTP